MLRWSNFGYDRRKNLQSQGVLCQFTKYICHVEYLSGCKYLNILTSLRFDYFLPENCVFNFHECSRMIGITFLLWFLIIYLVHFEKQTELNLPCLFAIVIFVCCECTSTSDTTYFSPSIRKNCDGSSLFPHWICSFEHPIYWTTSPTLIFSITR